MTNSEEKASQHGLEVGTGGRGGLDTIMGTVSNAVLHTHPVHSSWLWGLCGCLWKLFERLQRSWLEPEVLLLPSCVT